MDEVVVVDKKRNKGDNHTPAVTETKVTVCIITHLISRSSQCSTTGVTKAMVCVILSVGCC